MSFELAVGEIRIVFLVILSEQWSEEFQPVFSNLVNDATNWSN